MVTLLPSGQGTWGPTGTMELGPYQWGSLYWSTQGTIMHINQLMRVCIARIYPH